MKKIQTKFKRKIGKYFFQLKELIKNKKYT